jgi:hypothetical protein
MVQNELERYADYFADEPLELALVLAGLAAGMVWAVRGSGPARLILLGLLAAFTFFVVAVSMKSQYYMLLTYPFYVLLVARLLERAGSWIASRAGPHGSDAAEVSHGSSGRARGAAWTAQVTLAALVILAALGPLRADERAWDNYIRTRRYRPGQEYADLTAQLGRLAGPEARVMGPPVYWIGLHEHSYVDIFVYERLERQYGMSAAQFLDETRPDFVITDAKIATEKRVEKLLYNELDARATRELLVRHKNYGDVAIYRLRW